MKLKSKPSSRMKKRYLLLEGKKEDAERAIIDYIGVLGYTQANPIFVGHKGEKLILSIDRKKINNVRAAFELYGRIKVLGVSGTIRGLD